MATTEIIKLPEQSQELQRFMPVMSLDLAIERRENILTAFQKLMREGQDYGKVPGAGSKPTLLQPGAQKLDNLFGLVPRFIIEERDEDWSGELHGGEPFFRYLIKCQVLRGEFVMGEAIGECNSWESKYRYRTAERICPTCGVGAIILTKKRTWWCAKFKGGCNAGFSATDERITKQETGRKPNSEIFDQVNTLLKMAQKRAHVAATINATSASEFFTQDMEDVPTVPAESPEPEQAAAPKPPEPPKDERPVPEELIVVFRNIDGDPKTVANAFKMLEDELVGAYGGPKGSEVYSKHVLVLREKYPKGSMLPVSALKSCLLDLFEELTIIRDSKGLFAATDDDVPEIIGAAKT